MGRWEHGKDFLIVLGDERDDCIERLPLALSDYTIEDLERLDAHLEHFAKSMVTDEDTWIFVKPLSRNLLREQHAKGSHLRS